MYICVSVHCVRDKNVCENMCVHDSVCIREHEYMHVCDYLFFLIYMEFLLTSFLGIK